MKKLVLIAIFAVLSMPAMADMYTNETAFEALLQPGYYLEDFDGFVYEFIYSPLSFGPVNGFSYEASASNDLYGSPGALSTNTATDPLTITFTGDPVTAVGGLFFGGDINGNTIPASVIVTLSDGTIESYATSGDVFRGFTSTMPISYLTISTIDDGGGYEWPTMDHFYVGSVVVPVPAAVLLGILGIGAVGIKLRKFA